jgi:peptide chain release factor subunit 1
MELTYYFNRVAQITREYFIDIYPIKGLIISGPGPTKEEFVNDNYLEYRLQNMVISTIDASYAGAEGIRESFTKSMDILSNFRLVEEKQIVDKLFKQINSNSGLGVYGLDEILNYLKNNVVGTVIITDSVNLYRIESKCNKCKHMQEKIVERIKVIQIKTELKNTPCPSCKSLGMEVLEQDIIEYISLLSAKTGTTVEVISGVSEHGSMITNLGKIGAILRYNPNYTN